MSQYKKASEPPRKSNPLLGLVALIAIVAAVAVFLFTRPKEEEQQITSSPAASSQPAPEVKPPAAAKPPETAAQQTETTTPPATEPQAQKPQAAQPADHAHDHSHDTSSIPSPVSAQNESDYRIPAHYENPDEAEPLAATLDPSTVQPHARESYQIAQKKPRLLAQLPCFCYCDRFGHKSLHDCYVSNHAEECEICMREAVEADKMDSEGMTPQEIRDAIIATHHPRS